MSLACCWSWFLQQLSIWIVHPINSDRTASRLISIVVSLVGDVEEVRKQLQCSSRDLIEYCAGSKGLTQAQVDTLLDLILHEQGKLIAENRELLAQIAEKTKLIPEPPS
jgi:hypothetical protein